MTARVLVVDDHAPNIKLLEARLSAEYFDVATARDGPSALEIMQSGPPDIVLLDVMMPGMDGFEVCRRIRANPATAHIPVVMITALSDSADRVAGLEAGADDFLTKPVNDLALFARVRSLVRLKTSVDELRLREGTGETLGVLAPTVDEPGDPVAGARILLVDDEKATLRRIDDFATENGCSVTVEGDPEQAPVIAAAGDFDVVMINLNLDRGDALRLVSRLRTQDETRAVPIVLLIAEGDAERLAKGLEIGVNDYLVQPWDRAELLARLRTQARRKRYQDRLRANYRASLAMAVTDTLTGAYNRRYFDVHIQAQQERAARAGKPISLLMIDIDHFKQVNDTRGHQVGDEVLVEVVQRVTGSLRGFDMVARLGGEEFVVVMPDAGAEGALAVAERLRQGVDASPVPVAGQDDGIAVTVSIGVATSPDGTTEGLALLERADQAMYEAKKAGRNRVVVWSGEGSTAAA